MRILGSKHWENEQQSRGLKSVLIPSPLLRTFLAPGHGNDPGSPSPNMWLIQLCKLISMGRPFRHKVTPFGREEPIHQGPCKACFEDATDYQYCTIRSVARVLSSPSGAPSTFCPVEASSDHTINIVDMQIIFNHLFQVQGRFKSIFPSLYRSVGSVHMDYSSHDVDAFMPLDCKLTDEEASHVVNVALGALVGCIPETQREDAHAWHNFAQLKASGLFHKESLDVVTRRKVLLLISAYSDELAARLMKRILRVFVSRTYRIRSNPTSSTENPEALPSLQTPTSSAFVDEIVSFLASFRRSGAPSVPIPPSRKILEWARSILHQEWDSKAEFSWSSDVGCAVEFLRMLCKSFMRSTERSPSNISQTRIVIYLS